MALIEREAAKSLVKKHSASLDRQDWSGRSVLALLEAVPTIDPIRAAGGCRCGECKSYGPGPFGYGCHTMFDGKAAVIPHNPEHFCGDGEPKEMKNDG